jgi:hypothetical protein
MAALVTTAVPMSANDVLSLSAHFEDWSKKRASSNLVSEGIDPFEYYCVDQFLKRYGLPDEEIISGITGGPNDGGVDALYFLINRKLVDAETEIEAEGDMKINLEIFQVKQANGFSPTPIEKLYFFTEDMLDLTQPALTFKAKYNARLIELMDVFKSKYPKLAFPDVNIDYYYVTKADDPEIHPRASGASEKLCGKAKSLLSNANCTFHFIDAAKLWKQVQQRPPKTRALKWSTTSLETPEGYVGLVKLKDYYNFIQDSDGSLYERIFESNVRGFQKDTEINRDIRRTLATPGPADFWLLNNGITILASKVGTAGYQSIAIEDPQVVNGLQTSREIFGYYRKLEPHINDDDRRLLVRVIKPADSSVREEIVRATNNQNRMPPEALRATDQIHGYIESVFAQSGLYYDRRPGECKDKGVAINNIVGIVGLLQAVVSIVLQKPHEAYGAPGRYIKDESKYNSVFGDKAFTPPLYLNCVKLQRRVDEHLLNVQKVERAHRQKVRFYLATYVACAEANSRQPSVKEVLAIDADKLEVSLLSECFDRVWPMYVTAGADNNAAKGSKIRDDMLKEIKDRFPLAF